MIKEYFDEMLEEFDVQESSIDKLKLVVEYGKELEDFPQDKKQEKNKVPGCISNVYLYCEIIEGKLYVRACSDALIVAGYLSILLEGINGNTPKEIINNWGVIEQFTKDAGFKENLSPTRANAFGTILNWIYSFAKAHLQEPSQPQR